MLKDDERNGKRYTTSQRQRISYGRYGDYRQRRFEEGVKDDCEIKTGLQDKRGNIEKEVPAEA